MWQLDGLDEEDQTGSLTWGIVEMSYRQFGKMHPDNLNNVMNLPMKVPMLFCASFSVIPAVTHNTTLSCIIWLMLVDDK